MLPKNSISIFYLAAWLSQIYQETSLFVAAFPNAPVQLSEELGCSPTLSVLFGPSTDSVAKNTSPKEDYYFGRNSKVYFDPLGLATDENFARYREAELKHGRAAMIAFVASWVGTYSNSNAGGAAKEATSVSLSSFSSLMDFLHQTPPVIQLVSSMDSSDLHKFVAVCGLLETIVLVQVSPQDMPGDYGLGFFGRRDKGANERSLVSELENGRLAMMVMLYYLVQETLRTHLVWLEGSVTEIPATVTTTIVTW